MFGVEQGHRGRVKNPEKDGRLKANRKKKAEKKDEEKKKDDGLSDSHKAG